MAAELSDPAAQESGALQLAASIPGRRKAAMLLATLGPDVAGGIVAHLREDEVEALSLEMAALESVDQETAELIMTELAERAGSEDPVSGGVEVAHAILTKALGEERADILLGRAVQATEKRPFEQLRRASPDKVASFLQSESAQTTALVLAYLDSSQAAQVLARLPEPQRPEIALRIARIGEVTPQVIVQIEELAKQRMRRVSQKETFSGADGIGALADILGHSDRTTERSVLEHLSSADGVLAEAVRGKMFIFEDLVKLDDRAIQQVLREADQKDVVLAIRGADDQIKERILTNMSERGAEMLKEELEIQQGGRKADIDAAQSRIVGVVRSLESAGTIMIPNGEQEDGEQEGDADDLQDGGPEALGESADGEPADAPDKAEQGAAE